MLKKIINLGAIYYTCISAVLLVFSWIFGRDTAILDPVRFLTLLLFSFVMSTGSAIYESDLMGKVARGTCHAICYIGGFFFCVLIPYGKGFVVNVIALIIFSVIYVSVRVIKSVAVNRHSSKKHYNSQAKKDSKKSQSSLKKEDEYKSLFSGNDNDRS